MLAAYGERITRVAAGRDATETRWVADPPSSRDAFAEAAGLEAGWLADVAGTPGRDTRPRWVRRRWDEVDRAAGIDRSVVDAATGG